MVMAIAVVIVIAMSSLLFFFLKVLLKTMGPDPWPERLKLSEILCHVLKVSETKQKRLYSNL